MDIYLDFSFFPASKERKEPYFIQVCDPFSPLNLKKKEKMMKKKYAMTLLEIMIVIVIIGIISSVVGFNMKGSLDKGKAFKTREGISKLYEIVQLEEVQGNALKCSDDKAEATDLINLLKKSGMVKKPNDFIKDGWGESLTLTIEDGELRPTSSRYVTYCSEKGITIEYPWDDQNTSP